MSDWENHLTTIFPDVRLKRYLEMRGADGGSSELVCALPALWVGLLYDRQAQAEALSLVNSWTQDERDYLRTEVGGAARQGWAPGHVWQVSVFARVRLRRHCLLQQSTAAALCPLPHHASPVPSPHLLCPPHPSHSPPPGRHPRPAHAVPRRHGA